MEHFLRKEPHRRQLEMSKKKVSRNFYSQFVDDHSYFTNISLIKPYLSYQPEVAADEHHFQTILIYLLIQVLLCPGTKL